MAEESVQAHSLEEFGYKQQLKRGTMHKYAMFALSYALISVLVGATTLTGFGIANAGPAFWWTWVALTGGQLLVGLVLAEVAAEYPLAGSIYNWARQITSPLVSWLAGLMMLITFIIAVAGVALSLNIVLPTISPSFIFVGDGTGASYGQNAFIIGTVAVIISTIINMMRVKVAAWINTAAVVLELGTIITLVIAFLAHNERGPAIVTDTAGTAANQGGNYAICLLLGIAAPAWVLFGFDTAGTLAEESANPRHEAPRAIVRSLLAAGLSGIFLVLTMLMALPQSDIDDTSGIAAGSLPYAIKQVLGEGVGTILNWALAIAIFAAVVAIQHGVSRYMFAMARDNNLPFGSWLSKVNERNSPAEAAIVVGTFGIALMALNLVTPAIVAGLASLSISAGYIGYLCLTIPLLKRRFEGKWPLQGSVGSGYFSLGRWGKLINLIAVVWGVALATNLAMPWKQIYNPVEPFEWWLQWFGVIFIASAVILGSIWFQTVQRHRTGVVELHRSNSN